MCHLLAIQRLLPKAEWQRSPCFAPDRSLLPAGSELANLAFRVLYDRDVQPDIIGDMVVRTETYQALVETPTVFIIDYYGVTFDHLVPAKDTYPETLQINIIEVEDDEGKSASKYLPFEVDPSDYVGKKFLLYQDAVKKGRGLQIRRGLTIV
ncbi:hypothetical protein FQN57_004470 [Myotisia sp. PD_48]|nr:hypothetical protein FQN57_004470 [Myotisia sp. PD_48]